jgi:hypothetical protein
LKLDFSAEEVVQAGDVCKIIFEREKGQIACRLFLDWLKKKQGYWASKTAVLQFSEQLDRGKLIWRNKPFKYAQRNFYMTILKRLMRLGLVSKGKTRYDERLKRTLVGYAPVELIIPKEPPRGDGFFRTCWYIAKYWMKEWSKE